MSSRNEGNEADAIEQATPADPDEPLGPRPEEWLADDVPTADALEQAEDAAPSVDDEADWPREA